MVVNYSESDTQESELNHTERLTKIHTTMLN